MKKLITIAVIIFSQASYSENSIFQEKVNSCIESMSEMRELYDRIGKDIEADCKERATGEIEWEKSGKPVFKIVQGGVCSFLSTQGSSVNECLPKELPNNFTSVQVEAEPKATNKDIVTVTDYFRDKGIEHIALRMSSAE